MDYIGGDLKDHLVPAPPDIFTCVLETLEWKLKVWKKNNYRILKMGVKKTFVFDVPMEAAGFEKNKS